MVNNYVEENRAVLSHTHLSQLECDVGKVFAFKVEHDDPLVQALPQVDKRVEVEGGDVGASPPLRPGLSPLLVLDPAALLHPLLCLVVQLVHLDKDLVGRGVKPVPQTQRLVKSMESFKKMAYKHR